MNGHQEDNDGATSTTTTTTTTHNSSHPYHRPPTSAATAPGLEEKIQAALATLRRDRDKDYRAMVEAQERERHARDELVALESMVHDLSQEYTRLVQENATVQAQLGPLESHVHTLAEQVRRDGTVLVGLVVLVCPGPGQVLRSTHPPVRCVHDGILCSLGQLSTPRTLGLPGQDSTTTGRHGCRGTHACCHSAENASIGP